MRALAITLLLVAPALGEAPRADAYGDPLPEHVVARLGTTRFRHDGACSQVAFSPDGRLLASIGFDRTINVWEVPSGRRLARVRDKSLCYAAIAFSPSGAWILTQSFDDGVQLRSPLTAEVERNLCRLDTGTRALALSSDGRVCAAAGSGVDVYACEVATGRRLLRATINRIDTRTTIALRPDGRRLVSCVHGVGARMWDLDQGKEVPFPHDGMGRAEAASWSPDGRFLAVGLPDGEVLLSERERQPKHVGALGEPIVLLQVLADGETLLAVGCDGTLARFSIASWHSIGSVVLREPEPHLGTDLYRWGSLAVSPDGKYAAYCDRGITIWDARTGEDVTPERCVRDAVRDLCLSPGGTRLAAGSYSETVRVWDLAVGGEATAQASTAPSTWGRPLGFDDTGEALIVFARAQGVRALRASDLSALIDFGPPRTWIAPEPIDGGRHIATGGFDGGIVVQDLVTGQETLAFQPAEEQYVDWLDVSPDGETLASCESPFNIGAKSPIRLWNVSTGTMRRELPARLIRPMSLHFTLDGTRLMCSDWGDNLQVWEVETGRLAASLTSEDADAGTPTPGGRFWVCAARSGELVVRRLSDLGVVWKADADCGAIHSIAVSWDGRGVYTGMADSTILVWELPAEVIDPPPLAEATDAELCGMLGSRNAWDRDRARMRLIARGDEALPALRAALSDVPADTDRLRELVAQLDASEPSEREAAQDALQRLAWSAERFLREALARTRSAEARARLAAVIEEAFCPLACPRETRGRLHAVWVLERIGTPAAITVLGEVACRRDGAREGRAAREALAREDFPDRGETKPRPPQP